MSIGDIPLFSKGMLEGNYNSYVYQGTITVPNLVAFNTRIYMHIDEIRNLLYIFYADGANDDRLSIWNLDTLTVIYTSPALVNYWWSSGWMVGHVENPTPYSTTRAIVTSRNRYVYILLISTTDIAVWKDGALMQTINMLLYDPAYGADGMKACPSGKWFITNSLGVLYVFRGAT